MTPSTHIRLGALLLSTALAVCAGCDTSGGVSDTTPPPVETREPDPNREVNSALSLALVADTDTTTQASVRLRYQRKEHQDAPRAFEFFIHHDTTLQYTSHDALDAVTTAQKEVVVQEKSPGVLRVIIYASSNLNRVDTGDLLRLHFTRSQPGRAKVELDATRLTLAPASANQGLLLPEPLILGGN